MSKFIKITPAYLEELKRDFEQMLNETKLIDGKINFTKTFPNNNEKATVYFTAEAWAKMVILIKDFDKEVAWHGVVHRAESDQNEYIISDILVYPQTVTGTTVEMDTEKYANWIMENIEDERFDNIHMQGHSHVSMGTTPSTVDINHQEEILNMLDKENFYIFMIWNKSFSSNVRIFDLGKNILFETEDISVKILGGIEDLDEFLKNAKELVVNKSHTTGYYGNYQTSPYQTNISNFNSISTSTAYNPLAITSSKSETHKITEQKKGKKKEKKRTKLNNTNNDTVEFEDDCSESFYKNLWR